MRFCGRTLMIMLGIAVGVATLSADDAKPPASSGDTSSPANKEKLDFYRKRHREYRLFVEGRDDNPCEFHEDPLVRWDNPISKNADDMMFLWTDRGRPVVATNGFFNFPTQIWGRVFVSLTDRPIEMRHGDQPFWKPRLQGSPFKPLNDAKPPSDKASTRLVQMRNIAKEFQVICNWGGKDKSDWQMRLLPTPLYRYQVHEEGVVEGAMFGYVQAGPEAVLLLEARQTAAGLEWHYKVSRCTTYRIRFARHEAMIAEFPFLDEWVKTDPFYPTRMPLTDYPFGNPFEKGKPADKGQQAPSN
ncbi:MAG: hypothetical protein NT013_11970 [Planctomycetia bacterium]|nr:hypothetical protein [Planctomycetia bacterium]